MNIGCVIMASGMARRFGSNKLLADFHGRPMMDRILDSVKAADIQPRVVVTRHPEVVALCRGADVPALLHDLPHRNDTVTLGLRYLLERKADLDGVVFTASDQPCLKWESLAALCRAFEAQNSCIFRLSFQGVPGNPVLFPAWTFPALLNLPQGKGGSVVIKAHPEALRLVEASDQRELIDVDTPQTLQQLIDGVL